ncbi:DUF3298 and DUF4163 domain-containing protein [Novosphingobium sp. RD2P27]|uniref:DUF3298 and DUF4163 domain-containing protein n=1 Tax=Novosphingobium kalidii TaxID=3230299 RepID=A0ABV2CXG7_9SPHN
MQRTAFLATIALTAAGCDAQAPAEATADARPATAAATAVPSSALASPTGVGVREGAGRTVDIENELFEFEYSYPAAAGAIPDLKALLDKRLAEALRELKRSAATDQREAGKAGYPYRKHSFGTEWEVVTSIPRWLSLSADKYTYTGGAHGMAFFDSLLWDKTKQKAHEPTDLFTSKKALSAAIREPFCAALDKEREKRRGEPVERDGGDQFDECIDPVESTLILGSSDDLTFDRLGILVGPYAAGPYAEGTYEITLPVTEAVLAVVKPNYRGDFTKPR